MIDSKDISVVVQGAIDSEMTPICLQSLRKYLPKSEIILSTWKGSDTGGLEYDVLVESDDPGGHRNLIDPRHVDNLNRQIVSTIEGIKRSSRKYLLKTRSDLIWQSVRFLKYFHSYPVRDKKYSFFKERVCFSSYFFKKYLGEIDAMVFPSPFHLSDWMMFGLKLDIENLFSCPLVKEPEFINWFFIYPQESLKVHVWGDALGHKYIYEQYLFYDCIKRLFNGEVPRFDNVLDYTDENIKFSEKIVANNCIIMDPDQMKFYNGKKNSVDPYRKWSRSIYSLPTFVYEGLYTNKVFLESYKKHADDSYRINCRIKIRYFIYKLLHGGLKWARRFSA